MRLEQRFLFDKKSFELSDSRVKVRQKSLLDETEWEARYNELGLDVVKMKNKEGIGSAVFFGALLIVNVCMAGVSYFDGTELSISILFTATCLMWLVALVWTIQKYITASYFLTGGKKTLEFVLNSPSESEVVGFIDEIRKRVTSGLRAKLTTFDPDLSFDQQLADLKYLVSIEVLNQPEFEVIREDLRNRHLIK